MRQIPPRVPEEIPLLNEAVMLLGDFVRTGLRHSRLQRIAALVGDVPRDAKEAAAWKTNLKGLRKELTAL